MYQYFSARGAEQSASEFREKSEKVDILTVEPRQTLIKIGQVTAMSI